jgi:hypothetical protein
VPEQPGRHLQVLAAGHRGLDRGELARQADVPPDAHRISRDIAAPHAQLAARWLQQSGDGADERGLAGAIRPEDRQHLPGRGDQVQSVEGGDLAEPDGEAACFKERRGLRGLRGGAHRDGPSIAG